MIPTIVAALLFGLITIAGLVLNVFELVRYLRLAKVDGPGSRMAIASWIVSFASWWTGPLLLLAAPAAVVMGATQVRKSHGPTHIAAMMAILNGAWIICGVSAVVLIAIRTHR